MKCAHRGEAMILKTASLGLAAYLATSGISIGQESAAPAGAVTVTGTLKITIALQAGPGLPDGTALSLLPSASVDDAIFNHSSNLFPPSIRVAGGKANATLTIPYKWLVASRKDLIRISVDVSGGSAKAFESTYFTKSIAIPANGTETTVHFVGSI